MENHSGTFRNEIHATIWMMGRGLLADPGKKFQKRAVFWKTNPDFRFRIISEDLKTNFSKIPWKDFPAIHDPDGLGQTTWARWKKFPAGNLWKFLFHILKKFPEKLLSGTKS